MALDRRNYASALWNSFQGQPVGEPLRDLSQKLARLAGDLIGALAGETTDRQAADAAMAPYLIPAGGIIIWTGAACPDGFTEYVGLQSRFPMGNPALGTVGDTGGQATETPTISLGTPSTTMTVAAGAVATVPGVTHNHIATASPETNLPPYEQVLFCQKS